MNKYTQPLANLVVPKGLQTGPFGSQLKAEEYTEDGIPVVMPKDIYGGKIKTDTIARTSIEKSKSLQKHFLQEGDILFPRRGDLGRIAVVSKDNEGWICGTGCLRARLSDEVLPKYIHQFVLMPQVVRWLENNALGQTMLNLNTTIIGELPVYAPPMETQESIADALHTWDNAIEKTEALIAAKEKQFEWLKSQLLSNNPKSKQWNASTLGEFIVEKKEKSTTPDLYPCLTSSRRGIFLQEDYFSKQVASKDNSGYKIMSRGDFTFRSMSDDGVFVFNKQNIIDKGLISPAYGVFSPKKNMDSDFLYYFLNSPAFKRALSREVQGGTRTALKLNALKKLDVKIPCIQEQKHIASKFNIAKKEIDLLKEFLERYRSQKRGLMQKLLTGEWQVNSTQLVAEGEHQELTKGRTA